MNDNIEMWSMTLNMTIAAYLNENPDAQVRKMAKRYKKTTNNKTSLRTLKIIIKSSEPSKVVKVAYNELTNHNNTTDVM